MKAVFTKKSSIWKYKLSLSLLAIFVAFSGSSTITTIPAHASPVVGFNPGRIIDDAVFTDANSMNASQIQAFLNSKVPTCDTWHAPGYGQNPPFICLKDYTENGRSAAQIIFDTAQQYQINPQVFIVLLQKEQGLVTDTWPLNSQYRTATGYGCPDTAPCDSQYYGLTNQLNWSGKMFRAIMNNSPNWYTPYVLGNNYIRWSPNSSCGGSNVYIENRSTQALYNYTPYQPNQAALSAGYGTGDSCSAYGNRNFYLYFTDWFNPVMTLRNNLTMSIISQPDTTPARGQTISYKVSFRNNLSSDVTVDAIGIVGRLGNVTSGANRDFGWQGPVTLRSGVTQEYTFTTVVSDIGTIYAWPAVNYQGKYIQYNNWGTAMNSHQPSISLTSPLSMTPSSPLAGQSVTLSASIKNNEDQPIQIDALGIPIRYYGKYNYDVGWTSASGTLAPGATQTVSGTTIFDKPGPYDAWVSWNLGGQYTTLSPVLSRNVVAPSPNFTLTYLEAPNLNPAVGEDVAVKFKLKNNLSVPMTIDAVGVVGRYGDPYNGANRDFGWVGPETFAANEEKTYTSFTSTVSRLDKFYSWVAINYKGAYTHYNNWGFMMTPRTANLSISSPMTINSGNPFQIGQTVPVTVSIKNNENRPIRFDALGIPVRYYGRYNYDAAWINAGTFAASGQSGDTISLSGSVNFNKSGPYTLWTSININGNYYTIGSQKTIDL